MKTAILLSCTLQGTLTCTAQTSMLEQDEAPIDAG